MLASPQAGWAAGKGRKNRSNAPPIRARKELLRSLDVTQAAQLFLHFCFGVGLAL